MLVFVITRAPRRAPSPFCMRRHWTRELPATLKPSGFSAAIIGAGIAKTGQSGTKPQIIRMLVGPLRLFRFRSFLYF